MTAEKRYSAVCKLLREYDLHTGNLGAEGVIKDPNKWAAFNLLPFYQNAAELLIDCKAQLDTKTTPRGAVTAAGKIIKNAPRDNFRGIWEDAGKYWICDGFRLLRLNDDISSLPHVEKPADVSKAIDTAEKVEEIELPSAADLKAFISADKAKQGKHFHPTGYKVMEGWYCNPSFLLDMLSALPGCKAYKAKDSVSPMYFSAENGDGVLLPVRPPKD